MAIPEQLRNLRVSAQSIASSMAALHVTLVDSSGGLVTAPPGSTQVSIKEIQTSSGASVMDSTNNSIGVTIRAGSAAGTEYTDGDVDATPSGAAVFFDNSSNTMRVVSATRGLPVNIVAGSASSTEITIRQSTVGELRAAVYQSTAADLNVTVANPASTTVNVSSLAGIVRIVGNNAADGIVHVGDSTNAALRVNVVAGSAAGSTEATVRQSTYADFNTLSRLADRDASTNVANVTNTTPASTAYALAVRQVGHSTTVNVSSLAGAVIVRSSAADFGATVTQASTAWAVQLSAYSTTVNVSSLAGKVTVDQNSTVWPVQVSSVAGKVLVDQNSTVWPVQVSSVAGIVTVNNNDGSGNALASAVAAPSTGARGLVVRPVINGINSTTVLITSTHSTALYSLISSVAGARHKCFAYFVGSTHTSPSTLVFVSSNAIDRWAVNFGSGSSGVTGANLALSPPAWLFHTDAGNALNVRIEGGSSATSTVVARISLSWFSEA